MPTAPNLVYLPMKHARLIQDAEQAQSPPSGAALAGEVYGKCWQDVADSYK
ncbi:hypothetical protein GCM10027185_10920 [Spirosoma pulveris]